VLRQGQGHGGLGEPDIGEFMADAMGRPAVAALSGQKVGGPSRLVPARLQVKP
jgi:hypothetical protein